MLTTLGLLSLMSATGTAPRSAGQPAAETYRPRVEVWTDRGDDPYHSGQGARVHFRADRDAYVTILRVDTDGRVRVLFPREPWEDNFARGGREYEVQGGSDRDAFYVDDYPGVGYVFAVAAADPFVYDRLESNEHWDYRTIADGRVRGDPYVALTDLARRIVPDGYDDWDYDIVPYYVQQHYDYPRFLCYDCHSYVSYPFWSPYDYTCVRFRIVVYDDPYYYPYRYYGGTRVVFTRPARPEPRFIFRDRQGSDAFITRVRERPVNDDRRRDVGVRGQDLGGIGVIPPPRQRPGSGDQGDGNDRGRGRQHPDRPDDRDRSRGDRPNRPDQPDRPSQPDRPERRDRPDNPQNPDRPERRDRPERPDRPDRPERSDQPARPQQPERRAAPAPEDRPRAEPRREAPPARSEPRAEPKRESPKEKPRAEPELKRRKP
ncbi:MAG TPA: DUF4384 domain-containing protein [Gemmatimonadales bacterium]|nr:DUF4384 domain-containing protein [Gemmatimonadales bacterium]